jgi:hypothetical protein
MLSILIHDDGEDLFRLPSSEKKNWRMKTTGILNLPGKAVLVGAMEAFSERSSIAQLPLILGTR